MIDYKNSPNKWVRQAIYNALDGIIVNSVPVLFYDFRVPVEQAPEAYVLFDFQTATPAKTKCAYDWQSTCRLEVINQVANAGNPGSRVLLNDITDMVIASFKALQLEPASNLKILSSNIELATDAVVNLDSVTIYRQPINCSFYVV